jgi:flagellar biosynthesis anti-sigma factor FlgM
MKVQGPARPGVGSVQESTQTAQTKNLEQSQAVAPKERIQVSSLSKMLSEVRNAPDAPDVAKVERIKNEIDAGQFKIDRERTVETMMREEI